jgi:hypothetical protein
MFEWFSSWISKCNGPLPDSGEFVGACATMHGAYIQSIVTVAGLVIALLAASLAYRGALAPVKAVSVKVVAARNS